MAVDSIAQDKSIAVDLGESGLLASDMNVRPIDGLERAATSTPNQSSGYVIPYYDIFGRPLNFYRVRLFNDSAKYRQPKNSPTHVYFPPNFLAVADKYEKEAKAKGVPNIVIITEGEKKSVLACKLGIPTIAFGGVDSWRNRIIKIEGDPTLSVRNNGDQTVTSAKLDSGAEISEDFAASLAVGMQDFIDYTLQTDATIIIVFDSDKITGVKPQVQRAAATLGYELRSKGVSFAQIRQIILPWNTHDDHDDGAIDKMGLDDYLLSNNGIEGFQWMLARCMEARSAFPRHPSVVDYIGKRLQKTKLSRKEAMFVSLAILCELDTLGMRLRSVEEKTTYYFDFKSRTLMKAGFLFGQTDEAHDTPFGGLLYRRFGISAADQKALTWLSAQFNGEEPITDCSPERVIGKAVYSGDLRDSVKYQISDGQYCTVSATGLTIDDNGANGVLFEAGHVKPLDSKELAREFNKRTREPLTNWWHDVLSDTRLIDHNRAQKLHSLLYYISPWLYRWRGMQLPVELILGESGSGKSTIAEFRLSILTGDPKLRNTPQDIKDWYASVVNSGALHIIDNVALGDPNLRQRLSDELCRLVTESNPVVEQRKYYTNSDIIRYNVRSVFAMTAIAQPFQNADILQRAVVLALEKPTGDQQAIMYDMNWAQTKLHARGGRVAWVSHHLHVLQQYFKLAETEWSDTYRARHRLINLEQSLILMGKVFGWDVSWLPDYLVGITNANITDADYAFEGITTYIGQWKAVNHKTGPYGPWVLAADISAWAMESNEFCDCGVLINTRRLGKYMQNHKSMLASVLGVVDDGTYANRQRYKILANIR